MACILKRFSNSLILTRTKLLQQFSHVQWLCHISMNGGKINKNKKLTVGSLENYWSQRFKNENITEPIESIQHIIAHVLGTSKITDLIDIKEKQLNQEQIEKLELLCECRLSRMPVQYIIGEWDFRDITLKLVPPIFIPRPETEILVDLLLKNITNSKTDFCNILEIGCGSGAICLSVLHSNQNVSVVAIDMNSQACELTTENAKLLELENRLIVSNSELKEDGLIVTLKQNVTQRAINFIETKFDFIVSNPPYIPTKEVFKLQPEIILYEDITALDGGEDGCKLFKPILKYASKALKTGGSLILEIDSKHPKRIQFLIEKFYANILKLKHIHKDFCNNDRIVEITKE